MNIADQRTQRSVSNGGGFLAWRHRLRLSAMVTFFLLAGCGREVDVTLFSDATSGSGLEKYVGMTHGAAWGDYDGDGLPDLYVTNHLNEPTLFHNLGKGKFEDVTARSFIPEEIQGDKHGAIWADFDNDGRLDLVQLTGAKRGVGSEPKRLFRNQGERFADAADSLGVLNPEGRTRMPLWMDLDGDGHLDLFQGAEARHDDKTPPFVFLQRGSRFEQALETVNLAARSAPFCIVTELTGDNRADLLCRIVGKNRTTQVFDLASKPPKDLDLLPPTGYEDAAAADFDNDGRMDLFLARKAPPGPVAYGAPSEREVVVDISTTKENAHRPMALAFRARGKLDVQIASTFPSDGLTPQHIFIGQQGAHPEAMRFTLSPEMSGIGGLARNVPGQGPGLFMGFTAPDKWEVRVTASREGLLAGKPRFQEIQMRIVASAPISDLKPIEDSGQPESAPARLFMNRDGKFVEEGDKRGVNERSIAAMNVVAGDFDNDMDMDLFVLASGDIGQQENLLLLNRGDGHFDTVRAAGGAAGSKAGVGDSVTSVDFDGDGCLDLLLANGGSMGRSLGMPADKGGYQLFRNLCGNGNHWIQIDLEGVTSNHDGIGAIVRVMAGGVTQMRVQDGGVHHRGQNHSRLHFGLAKNARVEKITVHWPSGNVQEFSNVKVGQVMRIKERD